MKQLFILLLLAFLISSCSKWIAPYYTEVSKIAEIKEGMSEQQLVDKLGISPYNVYFMEDGGKILVFHYRHKQRRIKFSEEEGLTVEELIKLALKLL